jgi:predicted nucleic acid-binding protein
VLLLDNSAWTRLFQKGVVAKDRANTIGDWMDRLEIAVCLPFLLEAGYSARSAADRKALMARFDELPRIAIDSEVERMALQAQRELAD